MRLRRLLFAVFRLAGRLRNAKNDNHSDAVAISEHDKKLSHMLNRLKAAIWQHHQSVANAQSAVKTNFEDFLQSVPRSECDELFNWQSEVLIWVLFALSDGEADWSRRMNIPSFVSAFDWLRSVSSHHSHTPDTAGLGSIAWALATFRKLAIPDHEIIDGLIKFHHQHRLWSLKLFQAFSSHAAIGIEVRLGVYTESLLQFVELVDAQGYE